MARDSPAVVVDKVLKGVARNSHCPSQCAQRIAPLQALRLSDHPSSLALQGLYRNLGSLHVRQELPDLGLEIFGFDGDRVGEILDVGGRRPCVCRDARYPAHRLRTDASLTRSTIDAFGNRSDGGILLIHGRCHHRGDRRHFADDGVDLADGFRGIGCRRLN